MIMAQNNVIISALSFWWLLESHQYAVSRWHSFVFGEFQSEGNSEDKHSILNQSINIFTWLLGFKLTQFFVVKMHPFSIHPVRDLVASQRAISTATPPSRNFFSTFLPQGRRTPGKTQQFNSGSSPNQLAVGRKEPPTNPVRVFLIWVHNWLDS